MRIIFRPKLKDFKQIQLYFSDDIRELKNVPIKTSKKNILINFFSPNRKTLAD